LLVVAYRVIVTVSASIEKMGAGAQFTGAGRTAGGISQTVERSSGGTERYCYDEVEEAASEAMLNVLKMIELSYGRAEERRQ
jgi:hypothetical protein